MIDRFRTALRMVAHWATGAMLISLDDYHKLVPSVIVYLICQLVTMKLDLISPPKWKQN